MREKFVQSILMQLNKEVYMKEVLKTLKDLLREGKITKQAYRTYKGQVISGNIDGCLKGLQRKHLI